jgi:hypothetical protein
VAALALTAIVFLLLRRTSKRKRTQAAIDVGRNVVTRASVDCAYCPNSSPAGGLNLLRPKHDIHEATAAELDATPVVFEAGPGRR